MLKTYLFVYQMHIFINLDKNGDLSKLEHFLLIVV
jgi:hypothetical protein